MKRQLPPLNSLRAFEATARHLSFTLASEELNVTPAAVSQQVKILEEYFDVVLFKRLTRALLLTESGKSILPLLSEGFDKLAEADYLLRSRQADNVISVSVAPALGMWLLPKLDSFRKFAPNYDIRIDASEIEVDFARENVDLALRFGTGSYPTLISECLFDEQVIVVCSPSLLEGEHPLTSLQAIQHHTLLHSSWRFDKNVGANWRMWLKVVGLDHIDAERGPRFNLDAMILQAAAEGQGLALIDQSLASAELAKGNLVQPFDKCVGGSGVTGLCYYFVYPEARRDDPKVVMFRNWLATELGTD
jgi:LysR family glycine cleavage system transcriptional activator